MADQEAPVIEAGDTPRDFAAMALKTITTDPEAPVKETASKVPAKDAPVKKDEAKSSIPDSLFETPAKKDEAAAAKVEDAKSELDGITKPDFKNPKAAEQWDSLKTKAHDFEAKLSESSKTVTTLQARIAELEGKTKQGEELTGKYSEMEKKYNEAMELVRKVNIELDPDFRKTYVDGRKKLIDQARTIVDESGGNADDIQTALNLNGKSRVDALAQIAENMNSFQQGRLGRVIDSLTDLDNEASSKRSTPDAYLSQREEQSRQQAAKQEEERVKQYSLAYEDAFTNASKEIEVLRKVDGMPEWNQQAEAIASKAIDTWKNNRDATVAARKFIDAEAMPVFRKLFLDQRAEAKQLRTELEETKKELSGIYGNRPAMRGKTSSSDSSTKHMTFAERTEGTMNGTIPVA